MFIRYFLYIFLLLLLPIPASSQFFYFGRNKVQYTKFDWHVLRTEHFDIYYYPEMEDLAKRGAFLAEESYQILEKKFVHNVAHRIPLIFYSSHLHFEQTNTTPGLVPEGVGGFFEFIKGRVVIPYNGSMWDFQHVIRHELVHVFMYSKINRILLDHRMMQDRLPPLWFVEGLAEYWSFDWDPQAEMVIRDAVLNNYLVPLSEMEKIYGTFLMYKEGQFILKFISEHYGEHHILQLMENFWKSDNFETVFEKTLFKNYQQFDDEWMYSMKKKYYPLLASSDQPSGVSQIIVGEGFNSKPVFYKFKDRREIFFIGNRSGYTSIYRIDLDSALNNQYYKPTLVLEGEKTDEFEAFHLFQGNMAISNSNLLAFVTKSGEHDAIHIYDLEMKDVVETLRFKDIVAIGSISWSSDGNRMVFSAIDKTGSSDLYVWDTKSEELQKLTNDIYDDRDPDWSPDGKTIVFTSDRTPFGNKGKYNLFFYDLETNNIKYLTYGNENYYTPHFSSDGKSLIFSSDIGGARNVWLAKVDTTPNFQIMKKVTNFVTGAYDPILADSDLIFTAFENFSFQIRLVKNLQNVYDSSNAIYRLNFIVDKPVWQPQVVEGNAEEKSLKYTEEYSLDIAQSQISTDPVFGTAGGAFISLSDLLGNEEYNFLLYNTAQSTDELLSSFNVAISRLSLQRRTNYSFGIYRFSGRRYDLTDPDLYFYERVFGGYLALSYPLSKFRRISLLASLSRSEKDIGYDYIGMDNIDRARRALFLSNSISFTHDNSLWGPTGPLDGSRFNITLAYTSDIQYSHANYYSIIFDYRHYFRLGLMTTYATRAWLFYNDGQEARRFFMGGSWDLRGYPRWSLRGKKLWLTSNELRFPLIDKIILHFPFGGITLPYIRGALFFDAGSAWDDEYLQTLGSVGLGIRFNLGNIIVFRYDIGKRLEDNMKRFQDGLFYQFFFGWDF